MNSLNPSIQCLIPRSTDNLTFKTILAIMDKCAEIVPRDQIQTYTRGMVDRNDLTLTNGTSYPVFFECKGGTNNFLLYVPDKVSFQGTPGVVTEKGMMSSGERYTKIYNEYVDLDSGNRAWEMTFSDAPRKLQNFSRKQIPVYREQFITEMVRDAYAALTRNGESEHPISQRLRHVQEGRIRMMSTFLRQVAEAEWFQDGRLSKEFIKNARDNWSWIQGFLSHHHQLMFSDEASAESLIEFFGRLDPTIPSGYNHPPAEKSVLAIQWADWIVRPHAKWSDIGAWKTHFHAKSSDI